MGMFNFSGSVKISEMDKMTIRKCKITESASCGKCRKHLPRGSIVLGKSTTKFCLDCSEFIFQGVEKEFRKFMDIMWETKKDLALNNEKYHHNNLASSI